MSLRWPRPFKLDRRDTETRKKWSRLCVFPAVGDDGIRPGGLNEFQDFYHFAVSFALDALHVCSRELRHRRSGRCIHPQCF